MKFAALALAFPERALDMVEYFLDHTHHQTNIPIDMVSYHFYAALAYTENNSHRLLIVNRRNRTIPVQVPEEFVHQPLHIVAPGTQPCGTLHPRVRFCLPSQ